MIRVCWERDGIREETCELYLLMKSTYPKLFLSVKLPQDVNVNSGTNSCLVGESCHIAGPNLIFNEEACDGMAHVEKTLGFSPSSSIKRRQTLGISQ